MTVDKDSSKQSLELNEHFLKNKYQGLPLLVSFEIVLFLFRDTI